MEPRQEEAKDKVPRTEEKEAKPSRFRIVKLEERIAPNGSYRSEYSRDVGGFSCRRCC
jgi:hypothetical protein